MRLDCALPRHGPVSVRRWLALAACVCAAVHAFAGAAAALDYPLRSVKIIVP